MGEKVRVADADASSEVVPKEVAPSMNVTEPVGMTVGGVEVLDTIAKAWMALAVNVRTDESGGVAGGGGVFVVMAALRACVCDPISLDRACKAS